MGAGDWKSSGSTGREREDGNSNSVAGGRLLLRSCTLERAGCLNFLAGLLAPAGNLIECTRP